MKNRSTHVKLLAVLGLLGLVMAYLLVWKPKASDLSDARRDTASLNQQLAALTAAAATPSSTTTISPATKALQLAIPSRADLANLLRQINTIAVAAGVDQKSLTPAPASTVAGAPGNSIGVTISATGTRAAVNAYVRQLSALPRLFVVDKLSVVLATAASDGQGPSSASASDSYQVDLSGRVFTLTTAPSTASSGASTNG
jgi:Tfp pilus assembly protein PilO